MNVGAILFDSANSLLSNAGETTTLGSGWASVAGSPAVRVQSFHELPSDVLWLTNLTYSALCHTNLNNHPNYRSDAWLKSSVKQLVAELGADCDRSPVDKAAAVVSTLASRVISESVSSYGVSPRSSSLNTDFADSLNAPVSDVSDELYSIIEPIAAHPAVSVIRPHGGIESTASVLLRRNRLCHAVSVLSTPVPIGGVWQHEKTSARDGYDQWLEEIKNPFLVHCSITNIDPMVAEILSWGSGSTAPRPWLTDIEWRVVRQHADIKIGSVSIYSVRGSVLPQQKKVPQGAHAELSLTHCLIAEQIWSSLILKRPYFGGKHRYSTCSAWLRSTDRMDMFEYAKKLYAKGLDVIRYGNGNVIVNYQKGELSRIMDSATDLALMPPANKFLESKMADISHV